MSIPYRTQRRLKRIGMALGALAAVGIVFWLCWVIWLQRYVVYTDDGASLNFSASSYDTVGEEAVPPVAQEKISIFYNEGADAIDTSRDMTQINGYYITSDMFKNDYDNVMLQIERLSAGTAVMIEMKGPYGSFFYNSKLSGATISASTNIEQVEKLVERLHSKGFYTIARISAFQDRSYGESHVSSGLYLLNKRGLWMDPGGMFWLDPTNATTTSWISSVVLELKGMGFKEVVLDDFCFPDSNQYIFNGDKTAALITAAETLMSSCSADDFVLSFCVDNAAFPIPEGRSRLYIRNIGAAGINMAVSQTTFEEKDIRLVFLSETGDTRYDEYSVIRTLEVAEEVEARKGN